MKEHTSRFLRATAYVYLAFPVTYLLYAALLFNLSPARSSRIFFSFSYWALAVCGIAVGYGFREMTRWAWHVFLLNSLFVAYTNALIAIRYSESNNPFLAFLVSIALLVGLMVRLGKEIRVPYFLPKIRWWETNPRYKLSVPVRVERKDTGFEGEILDISIGGCFIKSRNDLTQNERILSRFELFGEKLEIGGTVVWRSQSSVTHPKGVGVKFDELDKLQRKIMKAVMLHLKKISALQTSRNRLSPEDFNQKMAKLKNHHLGITEKGADSEPDPEPGSNRERAS
ncbi:MAG: PilZ domain-containing protein [Bdellovibrionales bacterium]|nr:PilZ domain-containing protein [Bdellovibrionales bacterium]